MSDLPPEWAFARVIKEANPTWDDVTLRGHPISVAFARYIAAHEEDPADPLLLEAREIVAVWLDANPEKQQRGRWTAEMARRGDLDADASVVQALAALRRGIEIAGGSNGA